MNIIIIGSGKVGYNLAEHLAKEDHNVTIIDKNSDVLDKTTDYLDVMCIKGNGVSTNTLIEAGVREADLLIAVTTNDETNMVCCLTAKKLGVSHTIARIRDPEYANELSQIKMDIDLDMVINPEHAVAKEIALLLKFPAAVDVEVFARGRVEMVELKMDSTMTIVGMELKDVSKKISPSILIGVILRGDDVIIPTGTDRIYEDDIIYVVGRSHHVYEFCQKIGIHKREIHNVMIIGGGRIAYYLTQHLEKMSMNVCIVEINHSRCVELTELLPHTLIIHGDASDSLLLQSENVDNMDAFIAVTDRDEENLISGLMAKEFGVDKVVAKINRIAYPEVIKNVGIDNIVSPKLITTDHILRYVRGLHNAVGNPVETLYRLVEDRIEALEFIATEHTSFLGIPLKKLNIAPNILVSTIVRKNDIIIPHGNDVVKKGDHVILVTKDTKLFDLNDIVSKEGANR